MNYIRRRDTSNLTYDLYQEERDTSKLTYELYQEERDTSNLTYDLYQEEEEERDTSALPSAPAVGTTVLCPPSR